MGFSNLDDPARVLDNGVDLELVSNDAGVVEQTRALSAAVGCHSIHVEPVESGAKVVSFLEYRQPGKACLIDLEGQPLEESVVFP
jgi:hypothetical protein